MENQSVNTSGLPAVFSLPLLLNILVRRWRVVALCAAAGLIAGIAYGIIVKPLYRATAQIRPGIVAYTPEDGPLRGWAREDMIHYFSTDLFWQHMRRQADLAHLNRPPVIDAGYVASNLQFMPGGDVITLTNLSQSPAEAVRILNVAMDAFNVTGRRDSLGGDLSLTVRGIEVNLERMGADLDLVTGKEDRTRLEIEEVRREIALVDYEQKELDLRIGTIEQQNAWRRRTTTSLEAEVAASTERLKQAEDMLALSLKTEQDTGGDLGEVPGGDPVNRVLRQTASREQAGRVGDLLVQVNDLSRDINTYRSRADSLATEAAAADLEISRLKLQGDMVLTKKRDDLRQQISDREIILKRELPNERARLEAEMAAEGVKLEMISPLELVGETTVTDRPVRPRKLRAATILTVLGLLGGIFLALASEYYRANRSAIMQSRVG